MFERLTFLFRLLIILIVAPLAILIYLGLGSWLWVGALLLCLGFLIVAIVAGKKEDAQAAFDSLISLSTTPLGSERAGLSELSWLLDFTPQGWLLKGRECLGEIWDWLTESLN